MMKLNLGINFAVVQFGDDKVLNPQILSLIQMVGGHWYYFDEDADKEFEIEALRPHYDVIFEVT